jgi:aminopeptidase N
MITYAKGASVLRQLVAYVGEDAFVAGLRDYFARNAWGNAALDDLIGAVAGASGRDLQEWVAGWLDRAGTDTLAVDSGAEPALLVATGPDGTPPRTHVVGVGLYAGNDDGPLERREFGTVEVGVEAAPLPFTAGAADVVLVNDDDLSFAEIIPDGETVDALLDSAARLPTPLARSLAVTTMWGLVTTGRLPTARFLTCTTSVLAIEPTEAIVEPLLDLAVEAARLWSGDAERAAALQLVADTCVPIAARDGRVRTAALRGLASTASTDEHFEVLEAAAGADPDLRWRMLRRQAALGRLDPDAVAAAESGDADPDAWAQTMLVQASQPEVGAKDEAWNAVIAKAVPLGLVSTMGRAFWQPDQADLVAPYADRLLAVLPTLGRGGMIDAMALSHAMFPVVGIDEAYLDRLTTAVESADVSPVVRRTALGRADEVRRMLAARRPA